MQSESYMAAVIGCGLGNMLLSLGQEVGRGILHEFFFFFFNLLQVECSFVCVKGFKKNSNL